MFQAMSLSLVFGEDQERQLEPWASRTSSRELGRGWISERWLIACIVPPSPPVHCVLLRSLCIVHCAGCTVYLHALCMGQAVLCITCIVPYSFCVLPLVCSARPCPCACAGCTVRVISVCTLQCAFAVWYSRVHCVQCPIPLCAMSSVF